MAVEYATTANELAISLSFGRAYVSYRRTSGLCSIIGFYWIVGIINASDVGPLDYHRNAHTRHIVSTSSDAVACACTARRFRPPSEDIQIGEAILSPGSSRAQQRVFPELLHRGAAFARKSRSHQGWVYPTKRQSTDLQQSRSIPQVA